MGVKVFVQDGGPKKEGKENGKTTVIPQEAEGMKRDERGAELVGGDVRGAAAVAGGLGSLDVQVEQLHLSEGNNQFG